MLQKAVFPEAGSSSSHSQIILHELRHAQTVLSVTMRSSVLLCLAVSFAMFGFGVSLQCYSCPDGTSSNCEVKVECNQGDDTCLKITSGENTYTRCVRYTDCDSGTLSTITGFPKFTFKCCQSKLCNGEKKSLLSRIKEYFS
ncbi:CD59 glycoprotein-like [Parambassis ranga]|uniref:CD59 glycoprotein n=1 Tax=Parambassis ranga TaxID=210632 RepID=A0A6P7I8H8_9TELE|nr:CD59 glycoprotein-like [Parambassis ranga]